MNLRQKTRIIFHIIFIKNILINFLLYTHYLMMTNEIYIHLNKN